MILLAFFLPLAIYLLVLGLLNRRRYPLLVSGVWDGIGLVFGASGFLFFAGPAVFSSLSERWRLYWLLGKGDVPVAGPDGAWQFWTFLSILYFVLVVTGVAFYFWRQRQLTAIYNADAMQVEHALAQICERLGLNPVRSGGLFLFGLSLGLSAGRRSASIEKIQAPHYLPGGVRGGQGQLEIMPASDALEQMAILELDSFPLMRHVTLRWDPTDSPLRPVVETELVGRLAQMPSPESPLGGWLLTLGCLLLAFEMAGAFLVVLIRAILR
ncbi:MAG TPA: hypothetical protein VH682_21180 [Gemmataceae bacterium]|jgi:hypothetical protein